MAFVGEIRIFAGNFAPAGWAFCDGSELPISENDILFQLIGTTYGGDGQNTFALPNLQGRAPMHNNNLIGQPDGNESVTLTVNQLPAHSHPVKAAVFMPALGENPGTSRYPDGNYPAITAGNAVYSNVQHATDQLAPLTVTPSVVGGNMMDVQYTGNGQPKDNMQPYLVVNFIISLYGIYPSQT